MKTKQLLFWGTAALTAVLLLFSSCKDDKNDDPQPQPEPEVPAVGPSIDAASWIFGGEAGNYVLAVATDKAWNASSDATWIKLDKTSGEGEVGLGLTVEENTSGAKRTGTITIKAVADSKVVMTFKVIQEAIEYTVKVTSEDTIRDIPAGGQVIVIDVEANADYTFELSEWTTIAAAPSAVGLNSPFALTKSKITLNVDKNLTVDERIAYVIIKQGDEKVKEVVLIQKGGVVVEDPSELVVNVDSPDDDTLFVEPMGGVIKVNVTASNVAYDCTLTDWGASSLMSGSNTVTELQNILINPNLTFGKRERFLIIESKTEGVELTKMVTIIQQPVEITVTQLNEVPMTGGIVFLKVNCPEGIDCKGGDIVSNAVLADKTKDDDPDPRVLKFSVSDKNLGSEPKPYRIMLQFSAEGFEDGKVYPQRIFLLHQKAVAPIEVTWEGQGSAKDLNVVKENASDVDFTVTSEVPCTPVVTYRQEDETWKPDANGWISVVEKSVVESPYVYTLKFANSTPGTPKRTAQILFQMNDGFQGFKAIEIVQEEYPMPAEIKTTFTAINDIKWDVVDASHANEYYVTIVPADGKLEASVTSGDFDFSLTESSTPGRYTLLVFGKTANETDAERTGELMLTLKDKDGNKTLATKPISLKQEFKPKTVSITVDGRNSGDEITLDHPIRLQANGSSNGYKIVDQNGDDPTLRFLNETTIVDNIITIHPWMGPPFLTIYIVPTDFTGDLSTQFKLILKLP